MIGQLIIVSIGDEGIGTVKQQLEEGKIGGVILLKEDAKNAEILHKITDEIYGVKSKYVPFIAADQEGGWVSIMDSSSIFGNFLSASEMAKKTSNMAWGFYCQMADLLASYHFNLNFAPCVDLATNANSIIVKKSRSYGDDPEEVCKFARIFIDAHRRRKIATCLKHFPGHGSVSGDTHKGFVDATDTWTEKELKPYQCLLNSDDDSSPVTVMVSHVFNKNFDGKYPASLSKNTIEKLLRKDIGFDGVVISDSMTMLAIKDNYSLKETVIGALDAGVDILLFSNQKPFDSEIPDKIHEIIRKAVAKGELDPSRLEKSFNRVISLKEKIDKRHTSQEEDEMQDENVTD